MIWTLPNGLTMMRIIAAPVIAILVLVGGSDVAVLAFFLFIIASATDFLDGWLARRLDQESAVGKMLDPIADKAMVTMVLFALAAQPGAGSFAFAVPAAIIIVREIMVSGLREFLGEIKLDVTRLAKFKTAAQLVALGTLLLAATITEDDIINPVETDADISGQFIQALGLGLLWISAALTVISGFDYFRKGMAHIRLGKD
ncbi:MAG: CDP-diacylglycerol--glycerol-3-phosphate 3-phosphatidyltransferase [Pseudomonadota bacterium]